MKKIVCDNCGSENSKSYKYEVSPTRAIFFKDLCVNCLQDFVLKNQVKLTEIQNNGGVIGRKIIHG
jgi:hypothetical protein